MAARERATSTNKEEILALLKEDFFNKVDEYVSAVTAAIRNETPTVAEEIFRSAKAFLTQKIPNPTSQAITSVLSIANLSTSSSAESSPIESPIPRPLEEVRERHSFLAADPADQSTPQIVDVQLLPGERLLLSDEANSCLKLYNLQGQHLHTLVCTESKSERKPLRLAVLDRSATCPRVAVTLRNGPDIDIVEVTNDNMKVKISLRNIGQYHAVAAVDRETLAVGHWNGAGIDLIDLGGRVLRHICSNVHPRFMDITDDGKLVCSTAYGAIARVQIDTGTVDFNESVPQIEFPRGVATTSDGSILVTEGSSNMLHLVLSQDDSTKQLWSVPRGRGQGDPLRSVSADGNVCVCVTVHGSVYILDCLY